MFVRHDQNECNDCGFCLMQAPTVFVRGAMGHVEMNSQSNSCLSEPEIDYPPTVSTGTVTAGLADPSGEPPKSVQEKQSVAVTR